MQANAKQAKWESEARQTREAFEEKVMHKTKRLSQLFEGYVLSLQNKERR